MTEITYKEAMKLLEYWKKVLHLQDWTIYIRINLNPDEMSMPDANGCVNWTEASKSASIEICDPKFREGRLIPFNFESVLIHELLHLKMSYWCQSSEDVSDRLMHQTIEELARAFASVHKESKV